MIDLNILRNQSKPPVIAAIDVGTNSFHMVIASVDSKGVLNIIMRDKEMVRLGSSGSDMKYLDKSAIERGVNCLKHFSDLAKSQNAQIRAVATSAVREALNRSEFIEKVQSQANIDIEVVSGSEEGRLIYIGTLHALPIYTKKTLVIDIGGGSTETVIGLKGDLIHVNSEKLGTIRLTKRFFENGYTTKDQIKKCREYIKGEWAPEIRLLENIGFDTVVGTSGTIQTIASMVLTARNEPVPDVLNGLIIDVDDMLKVIDNIISADTPSKRINIPGMDPKRADIIIGGAMILEYFFTKLKLNKILISPYALREGIVFDTMQKLKDIQEFNHLSHLRYETVLSLCRKYQVEMPHAEHVKQTALQIFDELKQFHKLGNYERELLEASAMLHDCGYIISHDQHHKHSYYLITHSDMPGFTNDEAEVLANIARYHRKSHPKKKHPEFMALSDYKQDVVRVLAGILRLGEGIDRRRQQYVKSIDTKVRANELFIKIIPKDTSDAADIEIWGARRRAELLEEALAIKVNID